MRHHRLILLLFKQPSLMDQAPIRRLLPLMLAMSMIIHLKSRIFPLMHSKQLITRLQSLILMKRQQEVILIQMRLH